jgi:hypothetical protein
LAGPAPFDKFAIICAPIVFNIHFGFWKFSSDQKHIATNTGRRRQKPIQSHIDRIITKEIKRLKGFSPRSAVGRIDSPYVVR